MLMGAKKLLGAWLVVSFLASFFQRIYKISVGEIWNNRNRPVKT